MTAPLAMAPNPNNVMLGRGKIYGDRLQLVNGVLVRTGEFDLGNCTGLELTPKADVKEKYESMDPSSALYARAVTRQTHSLKITGDEYSLFNLANALMGNQGSISVTGASVTGEALTTAPLAGAFYPTKFRNISAVTLHDGVSTKVLGTDYAIDAASGRIQILPGGSILQTDTLTVDYTYATYQFNTVVGGVASSVDMYIRFKGNPVKGPTFEAEFWHVMFTPNGNLGFIADDFGNWTIEGMVIQDPIGHPNEPLYHLIQTA